MKQRIFEGLLLLVDMDLTIVPWQEHVEPMIQLRIGEEAYKLRSETEYFFQKQFGKEHEATIHSLFTAKGFFANLPPPIEGSIESIYEMRSEGIEVIICSTPMEDSEHCIPEKREWLNRYLGAEFADRANFPIDKSECHGDILIDDRTDLLVNAKHKPSWTQITFDAYHNRHIAVPHRLTHWKQWRVALEKALKKDSG